MDSSIRIPLVTPITTRNFSLNQDAKMVNCIAEKVGQDQYAAVKRSGLSQLFQGRVGCGQGLYNFSNTLYSVSGDYLNINSTFSTTFVQTTAAAGWAPRKGLFGAGFNGNLWSMGGVNGTTYSNEVWKTADGISWSQLPNAPWSARAYANSIVFGGLLWVMGGIGAGNTYASDVWSTADGLTWVRQSAAAWPGRANFGLTIFNSKLWVAGGQGNGAIDNGNTFQDVWSSSDGITWASSTLSAPWAGRSRLVFAGFNNKLIVAAGYLSNFVGAGGDQWSSADGVSWTRDSSNPFAQAATGVYKQAALTSLGSNLNGNAVPSLTGGGGAGAVALSATSGVEEDGADDLDFLLNTTITTAGTGYTSAPAINYANSAGLTPSGYTFLNANGVAGDKRGMSVVVNNILYFFTFLNNGAVSNEIWQTLDGVTWTLFQANPAYGARDSFAFFFGSFWVLSGINAASTYLSDVWKGAVNSGTSLPLTPTITCLPFSFSQTSATVTNPLLFFKSNKDAYTYNPNLATLTKVTSPNYPATTVPGIVYLDTYFFVMDAAGKIWNSAINDPTTWTALGTIPMQGEPNGGVAIGKVGQYLVALGVWSTQFFYDNAVAAPASPLAVNPTLDNLTGCASGDSVVAAQSTLIWLGQNRQDGRGIFMLQGYVPTRVSTTFIDRLLEDDNLTSVRAYSTSIGGHACYVLTLGNSNITLVYDFTTQNWTVFTSLVPSVGVSITSLTSSVYGQVTAIAANHGLTDGDPVVIIGASIAGYNGSYNVNVVDGNTFTYFIPAGLASASGATVTGFSQGHFTCTSAASLNGEYYLQHETNGILYLFDLLNFDDAGYPINVSVTTQNWDGNTVHFKTFPDISLLADNSNSNCLIRHTNDDYATFSPFRFINMGLTRKHITRNGRMRRRAWEIRHTSSTAFRAFALELQPEAGDW